MSNGCPILLTDPREVTQVDAGASGTPAVSRTTPRVLLCLIFPWTPSTVSREKSNIATRCGMARSARSWHPMVSAKQCCPRLWRRNSAGPLRGFIKDHHGSFQTILALAFLRRTHLYYHSYIQPATLLYLGLIPPHTGTLLETTRFISHLRCYTAWCDKSARYLLPILGLILIQ